MNLDKISKFNKFILDYFYFKFIGLVILTSLVFYLYHTKKSLLLFIILLLVFFALVLYTFLASIATIIKGIQLMLENKPNIKRLIAGYIMAVFGLIGFFTILYLSSQNLGLGTITYSDCSPNNNFLNDTNQVNDEFSTFYFSSVTFFTIGYGDICPTGASKIIAITEGMISQIFTIIVMGFVMASYLNWSQKNKK